MRFVPGHLKLRRELLADSAQLQAEDARRANRHGSARRTRQRCTHPKENVQVRLGSRAAVRPDHGLVRSLVLLR